MACAKRQGEVCSRPAALYDRLGTDVAAGARPVVDDEWLTEPLRQPLADQARDDVGPARRLETPTIQRTGRDG